MHIMVSCIAWYLYYMLTQKYVRASKEESLLFERFKPFYLIESSHHNKIWFSEQTYFLHARETCAWVTNISTRACTIKYCTIKDHNNNTVPQFARNRSSGCSFAIHRQPQLFLSVGQSVRPSVSCCIQNNDNISSSRNVIIYEKNCPYIF